MSGTLEPHRTQTLIEALFQDFGLDANEHQLSAQDGRIVYGLQRGSAQLFIILSFDDQGSWVQVISPILSLPPEERRLECFEHLLLLNSRELVNCSFGLDDGKITISSDRSTDDLQISELRDMILCVSSFADDYDDKLAKQFGCEMLGESLM